MTEEQQAYSVFMAIGVYYVIQSNQEGAMSQLISARVPEVTAERLRQYARRKQRSVNETFAIAVEEWLRQNEFAYIEFRDTPNGRMAYMKASRLPVWWV